MTTTTVHVDGRTVEVTPLPRRVGLDVTDSVHDESITVLLPFADAARLAAALDPDRATGGQWTRDDFARLDIHPMSTPTTVLDEVAAWLNTHCPKQVPYDQGGWPKGWQSVANVEARAVAAEHARDAAVARAEKAERELAGSRDAHQRSADAHMKWKERAEQAERERAEMKEEGRKWIPAYGGDPAVYVVRESDIAAIEVEHTPGVNWKSNGTGIPEQWTANRVREMRDDCAEQWIELEAVARAIEAEQAVDPVEELTDALADALYGDELVTDQMRGVLERVVRAGMLFPSEGGR